MMPGDLPREIQKEGMGGVIVTVWIESTNATTMTKLPGTTRLEGECWHDRKTRLDGEVDL